MNAFSFFFPFRDRQSTKSSFYFKRMRSILLLLPLCSTVEGIYFLVSRPAKCFTIDQAKGTPVVFGYEVMDGEKSVEFTLYYGSQAASNQLILSKKLHKIGHIDFITDNDGPFALCVAAMGEKGEINASPVRLSLTISYGHDEEYYAKIAKEEAYDPMNMEVHKLSDQINFALNEAGYQREKEIKYHQETERINSSLIWWPMVQVFYLYTQPANEGGLITLFAFCF